MFYLSKKLDICSRMEVTYVNKNVDDYSQKEADYKSENFSQQLQTNWIISS